MLHGGAIGAKRKYGSRRSALLSAVLLAYPLGLASCPATPTRHDPVPRGADAPRLASGLTGGALGGRAGDLLLERGDLRVVVASDAGDAGRLQLGSILDVTVGTWAGDDLRDLTPAVFQRERALAAAVTGVVPMEIEGRSAIRILQEVTSPRLSLETVVWLAGDGVIALDSTLRASEPSTGIAIGDQIRFHGARLFSPGVGFIEPSTSRHRAPWIAHRGRVQSYALAFESGEGDLRIRFHEGAPTDIEARADVVAVVPGVSVRSRRFLLVDQGGLETVVGGAWFRAGTSVAIARGEVEGRTERGSVTALIGDDVVLTTDLDASGGFAMPLPDGSYRLVLEAPGGTDETAVVVHDGAAEVRDVLRAPQPGIVKVAVTDGSGGPLPARVTVRGVAPTPDPSFGADELARGNANAAFTAIGEMNLELPAGRYDVVVSHGPEYAIAHQRIEVAHDRGASVRARLERVVDARDWVACDLHLHASPSFDSRVPLLDRVIGLLAEGVRFAAATDHNHVSDYAPAVEALAAESRIATAAGVEITTKEWGHFNAYPYPVDAPAPPHAGLLPAELFAYVRRVSPEAIVQVNHPRLDDIGYFNLTGFDSATRTATRPELSLAFDAIEVFNGFDLGALPRVEALLEEWFRLLEHGERLVAVGSSDSHKISHHWAGYPRTYVWVDGTAGAERPPPGAAIAAALRAGAAFVTNGPFVELTVDGQRPGAIVESAGGHVTVVVEVRAAPGIEVDELELVVGGKRRKVAPSAGQEARRWRYEETLAVTDPTWIVAVVRGSQPLDDLLPGSGALPFAFTNPVYFKAKGAAE